MIEFAGWEMPVYYSGINEEHRAVRRTAGIFDTSHMGEIEVKGGGAKVFLQKMTPNDVDRVGPGGCIYSALLNDNGGVIDDVIIYCKAENDYMICVNASNADKDFAWLQDHSDPAARLTNVSDDTAMLAIQGPSAAKIMAKLTPADLSAISYMRFVEAEVGGVDCILSRTGYTGENGFEIFFDAAKSVELWEKIFCEGKAHGLMPVGLGARDTLRIEMGYPLWGSELDEDHTPLESGIAWICRWDKGDFISREKLIGLRDEGVEKTIVGLTMLERGVPRHGYPVYRGDDEIGVVTSGTMSPSLNVGVALARVKKSSIKSKEVDIVIHGKPRKAKAVSLPFVERK